MRHVYLPIKVYWDKHIVTKFHDLSLGLRIIKGVSVTPRSEKMDDFIKKHEEELRSKYKLETLKDEFPIRRYRDFFWRMGIDPTKKRPASEALLRRILQGKRLPIINNIVDAYNLASAETMITLSAYDLSKIKPPLTVRFARIGESVVLIGNRKLRLSGKELVLTDVKGILCVYIHGDVERAKINRGTKDVLLIAYGAPGISSLLLREALKLATHYIISFGGGNAYPAYVFSA